MSETRSMESLRETLGRMHGLSFDRDDLGEALDELEALRAKANTSVCAWCHTEMTKDPATVIEHMRACQARTDAMDQQLLATEKDLIQLTIESDALRSSLVTASKERDRLREALELAAPHHQGGPPRDSGPRGGETP